MMTRLIINDMKKRGHGAIVNVSSGSELQPLPLMNVYAATKVYRTQHAVKLYQKYSYYKRYFILYIYKIISLYIQGNSKYTYAKVFKE